VGFVFYAPSPRAVSLEQAASLAALLPPFVTPIGLFVNATERLIQEAVSAIPSLVLQFHGDETPEVCAKYGRPFLRAARMAPHVDLPSFSTRFWQAQAILLDAHVDGYGGGGQVFDWSLIPAAISRPIVLSGGLHAGNVGEGIVRVRPWAVDVSSGVESSRGVKDAQAIHRFCQAVREADQGLAFPQP
jgi:phosphoribosylanthranilate isomerase